MILGNRNCGYMSTLPENLIRTSHACRLAIAMAANGRKIREGNGNYVEAYKYLHKQVQSKLHCADLSAARRKELEAQEFWLRKATEINGNDPDGQANHFIRRVTRNGLRFDDKRADAAKIQENSIRIGKPVMEDVLWDGRIPTIEQLQVVRSMPIDKHTADPSAPRRWRAHPSGLNFGLDLSAPVGRTGSSSPLRHWQG